ncbi:MAG: tripartite tricarboxylate transporter substrate binding protein [Proteobacteria bacterium]|nr:tripartite tricarboxylate transporter substrate binding protein [Burkholderiales bacterium]
MKPVVLPSACGVTRCAHGMAFALALVTSTAVAQQYPGRQIRLIAPFPPAGAVDLVGRPLAARMQEALGQQIVFENRPGAGGNIGAEVVAKSPADGYVLLMAAVTTHSISATLIQKLGYDLQKDLAPISLVANSPQVLVAHPSLPVKGVRDLITLARAKPGELNWASQGNGTLSHLEQELLKSMAKIEVTHVPYKGSSPALADLFGGQVSLLFDSVPAVLHHVRSGKLRALAVATSRRSNALPDVPTVAEAGLKGFAAENWFGLMAPGGTANEIITRLNTEAVKALATPDLRKRLQDLGFEPRSSTPDELRTIISGEIALWAKVIRDSGAKVE